LSAEKYSQQAERWSDNAYADARAYLAHRAELIVSLGPILASGESVLDLACGDAGLASHLPGLRYLGVDASPEMVDAGRRRGLEVVLADLNDYEPPHPVTATTCFRAIYYARDRTTLFRGIAGYTERKLVFDLNPRQYSLDVVRAELHTAGFDRLELRPFFAPQRVAVSGPAAALLRALERTGPLARLMLAVRFSYLCAAFRSGR
jgi:SAM-dependent methyltransferase